MKLVYTLSILFLFPTFLIAQDYYFPPNNGDTWETVSPTNAGWCADELNDVYTFLEEKNTKAFIILKDGKIAVEKYFDSFTQDSAWYWASAGKTITGFLVGVAQEEGLLNINDKTSDYLGTGWTSASLEKENLISIKDQLSMTTGLDDGVVNPNCLDASCLQYLADAGDRWSYHNAPYRLLMDVVEEASGQSFQIFTNQKLSSKIGMTGLWINRVFWSKPRSMARYGSLILNQGNWNGTSVFSDVNFMNDMVNTSQSLNPSYGYLWWLNGKGSYMLPTLQTVFNANLVPSAPDELYAALGKNDQKIYILPSKNIVIIRMGNASGTSLFALSSFDNELWGMLNDVFCENSTSTNEVFKEAISIFPNPVDDVLKFQKNNHDTFQVKVFNSIGNLIKEETVTSDQLNVSSLVSGTYFIQIFDLENNLLSVNKFFK